MKLQSQKQLSTITTNNFPISSISTMNDKQLPYIPHPPRIHDDNLYSTPSLKDERWGFLTPTFRLLRRMLDCCAMIKIIIPGCYLVCIAKVQSIFPGRDDEDPPNRCQNKIIPKMRNIAACARPSKAGETSFGGDGSSWAWGLETPTFRLLRRILDCCAKVQPPTFRLSRRI